MSEFALLRPILGKWSRMELLDLDLEFVSIISNTCGSIVNVYQYHHAYIEQRYCTVLKELKSIIGSEMSLCYFVQYWENGPGWNYSISTFSSSRC
jgi:hypothetical protein